MITKWTILGLMVVLSLGFSIMKADVLAEKAALTKITISQCDVLYKFYVKLGESDFRKQYSSKNYINDCIKLYKDPIWTYKGSDRVDKIYAKYVEQKTVTQKAATPEKKTFLPGEPYSQILSMVKLSSQKYLLKTKVCAGKESLISPVILIKSDLYTKQLTIGKVIPSGTCRAFESFVNAKSPLTISTLIL